MTDEVSGFMAEVLAEEWGVDRDCVDCLIYRNYDHPSKNSICDGCFGSATHPNFRPISGHKKEHLESGEKTG